MNRRRRLAGLVVAATLAALTFSAPAHAQYRQIQNVGSGLCAGFNWWEWDYNGATLVQLPCDGEAHQQWAAVPVGSGYIRFVNRGSGKCMDVRDGINRDWTPVQQWECQYVAGQYWRATVPSPHPTRIYSRLGGRCLDVRYGSLQVGEVIQIFHCTPDNLAQLWRIT